MKKMLVVVDMQNDFIDGTLGTKEAVAILPHVVKKVEAYKERGEKVYFTKDTHAVDYLNTLEGKNLPIAHCIKGTQGWDFPNQLQVLQHELSKTYNENNVFEKAVFGSEALADYIRKQIEGLETVEIELIGICTDICVISNAILFKTYLPEVRIQVDASCCAGVTPKSHTNALSAMKMCHIHIINE